MYAKRVLLISLVLALSAGCKTAAIYNPRIAVTPRDERQVADAIEEALDHQALERRPWIWREEKPGMIIAVLNLRSHHAMVSIEYGTDFYSIRYIDSRDLLYERTPTGEEVIHKNYNVWIQLLVNNINSFLELYERTGGSAD